MVKKIYLANVDIFAKFVKKIKLAIDFFTEYCIKRKNF